MLRNYFPTRLRDKPEMLKSKFLIAIGKLESKVVNCIWCMPFVNAGYSGIRFSNVWNFILVKLPAAVTAKRPVRWQLIIRVAPLQRCLLHTNR